MSAAASIGYPLVAKVASPDVPHRLEVGGVVRNMRDAPALRLALEQIDSRVLTAAPQARIEGYEIQQWIPDGIESIVGFTAAPPFSPMMVGGTGGSYVELQSDRCADLAPLSVDRAADMIGDDSGGS